MSTMTVRWVYGDTVVDTALAQGWTEAEAEQHALALADEGDGGSTRADTAHTAEEVVTLTHPYNALTEEQVEALTRTPSVLPNR